MSSYLIEQLQKIAIPIELPKGKILFKAGETVTSVYLVQKGRIALSWTSDQSFYEIESVASGGVLGLAAALNGEYSATARAAEDSLLGMVDAGRVNHALDCDLALCRATVEYIAQQIRQMRINAAHHAIPPRAG